MELATNSNLTMVGVEESERVERKWRLQVLLCVSCLEFGGYSPHDFLFLQGNKPEEPGGD